MSRGMSATTERSNSGLARTADEMAIVRRMLGPFYRAGYRLILLSSTAKVPIEKGWQTKTYTTAEIGRWLRRGGNIGILLAETDLVLDVDPRHGGEESLARLQDDLDINLSEAPIVFSGRGDGGKHIYLRKSASQRVHKAIPGYPGIDVKTSGGFVLAPGSRHPETGGLYRPDPDAPPIDHVGDVPHALLDLLRQVPARKRAMYGGGELSVEQLEMLLAVIEPENYRDYVPWFRVAAACHDATNGDGLAVWLTWAARDDHYGTEIDDERNTATWESLTSGKAGGITYRHLLNEVARAGRLDVVLEIEPTFVIEDNLKSAPDFSWSRKPISSSAFDFRGGKP